MSSSAPDVKSVRRTAEVIKLLSASPTPMRFGDIVKELGMPKSSTHAMLHTLVKEGVLALSGETEFSLSLGFLGTMSATFDSLDVRAASKAEMLDLSHSMKATCNLGVLEGHNIVYIEQVRDGSHPVQLATRIGFSITAHATALGKVLVGELGNAAREEWIQRHDYEGFTPLTILTGDEMRLATDAYRVEGFATDDEEMLEGIFCIAAPIRNHRNVAVAAVSATLFKSAMKISEREPTTFVSQVRATADRISAKLGASM